MSKDKKWFKPIFDFEESEPATKKLKKNSCKSTKTSNEESPVTDFKNNNEPINLNHRDWMKHFDPVKVEDLAVNHKKVQEIEEWIKTVSSACNSDMLLLTGPVGCGKTITVQTLAAKNQIKVTEWISPVDIEIPTEYGDFEFKEKQSAKFLEFIINAANFTSLLDNNSKKLVLVEDLPHTFLKTPTEFTDVLHKYRQRAKSPIVFICSESNMDSKNSAANLFTTALKEQFYIHHISLNAVSATGLKSALKRVAELITKKYSSMYNTPSTEVIECVVNSSTGDVRSAVLNLHFACLKGSNRSLETSMLLEKENKSKSKTVKKKKPSSKFATIGKDQTVTLFHGVGRVLNPKLTEAGDRLTHTPSEVIEQFLTQPHSFVNFLEENYLSHFSNCDHVDKAASAISDADFLLAEWREKMCQEYGLYTAVAGLMLANKAPVSAWNPVKGPKNMRVQYPTQHEIPLLEENYLYKGKVLVSDYQTYCKIITGSSDTNKSLSFL